MSDVVVNIHRPKQVVLRVARKVRTMTLSNSIDIRLLSFLDVLSKVTSCLLSLGFGYCYSHGEDCAREAACKQIVGDIRLPGMDSRACEVRTM